jgi:regulator of replication initiation timing
MRKLLPGSERFELVAHMLRERLSPEQVAGKLRHMNTQPQRGLRQSRDDLQQIYTLPVGEIRTRN